MGSILSQKNMQGISDDKISFRIFPHRCLWGEIVILLFLILPIIRFLKLLRYFAAWRLNRCGLGGRMDDGTNARSWASNLSPLQDYI